jgi:murein DD-endopeptidase MepM/ murein hydrolase activator NlpD
VRARFDLALEITRENGVLAMKQIPIAVDDTPLRIRGTVGGSLYAAARAAGADPETIQSYLKILSQRLSIAEDIGASDKFDLVVEHRRAATGETETGKLLFAGIERSGRRAVNMLRWTVDGRDQWFEASGVGERRGVLAAPVAGRLSSSFGMRFHPLLRYSRMHQGVDFAAAHGSPIHAVTEGTVVYAGRHGGHGNYVRINHGGGLGTGYAHMSRIAAYPGERVRQGQIIGYVGSTGLSTGPHLHYEVYRNGATVNPMSVRFTQAAQLAGAQLAAFKAKLNRLKSLPVGLPATTFATPTGSVSVGGGQMTRAR